MFVCFLLCTGFAVQNSARKIDAESDLNRITYKYYKSYYVETGDSLWSIAKANMNPGFDDIYDYIHEVKRCNQLGSDKITAGNYLLVPYYE